MGWARVKVEITPSAFSSERYVKFSTGQEELTQARICNEERGDVEVTLHTYDKDSAWVRVPQVVPAPDALVRVPISDVLIRAEVVSWVPIG